MVPTSFAVTALIVGMLLSLGVVVGLVVVVRRTPVRLYCVLVGVLTFAVSQLFTRLPLVSVVSLTAAGWVAAHPWLWLVLLAVTAGLFEETARTFGFRLLRREPDRLATPVGAGLGHGGLEAVALVGVSQIGLGIVLLAGPGATSRPLPPAAVAQLQATAALGPWGQVASLYERGPALILHVALSILVFTAVRTSRRRLVALAVVLHAGVDLVGAATARWLGQRTLGAVWLTELVLTAAVAGAVLVIVITRRRLSAT